MKHAQTYIDENRAKWKAAPAQDPMHIKFATALYRAGDSSYELRDFKRAQAFWEELITAMPASRLVPEASEGLGWIYFGDKNYEKAAAAFHTTAETPNNARAGWCKLMEGRSLGGLGKFTEALAAIKLAPTLSPADKGLEAEGLVRSAEMLVNSPKFTEMLDAPEIVLTNLRKLAKDFAALPATVPALDAATGRMYESHHDAEAVELADLYLGVTSANAAAAPKRAAIARMKARSLVALNKIKEAAGAARLAVEEANSLADAALKNEEVPASMMLLAELSPGDAAAIYKDVVEKNPQSRFALNAQYELARTAGEAGKIDAALNHIEALLAAISKAPAENAVAEKLKRDALFAAGHFAFHKPDHKKSAEYARAYQSAYGAKDDRADDVARKLGWSLHETGDDAGAITALDAALPLFSKSTYRDEMLYVRALAANKTNDAAAALKFEEQLVQEFPNSPFADDALFDAALSQFKQRQYEPSLAKLNVLLAKPSPKAELKNVALQLRASARLQCGQADGALADAEELLNKGAGDARLSLPALRIIKAMALLSQAGKEKEALAALDELISKGPADAPEVRQGLVRRAYILFKDKRYADAKADFVLLSDPAKGGTQQEALDAALHLVIIHRELKETPQAKALLEKMLNEKLEGIAAFEVPFQLGNIVFEASDNAGAVKLYERALANIKDVPLASLSAARLNLAWALRRDKANDKAEKAFAEVVKGEPTGALAAEALFERGRVLTELGKGADAQAPWKEILEHFADSPYAEKALFLLGQAQAQAGQFKEAAQSFLTHAEKYPNVNLRETLCGVGESQLHLNEMDKAREAFEKVLGPKGIEADLEDVNERALLGLADIALKAGDAAGAKKRVLRILTENPGSTWADAAYFISGQSSEVLKEPEKAIGYYRKLLTERPTSIHRAAAEERLRTLGAPQ